MSISRIVEMAAGAFLGGYLVGALPVAWILARRSHGVDLSRTGTGKGTTLEAVAVGGFRFGVTVVAVELLKGAIVGLGAHAYDDTAWFTATAIAGCVAGDAFPLALRHGRRGVPLISGTLAALPGAWIAGLVVAVPTLLFLALPGMAFETVVAVAVPGGFILGTRDPWTLLPAAAIVLVLIARSRLRRRARAEALAAWRRVRERGAPLVVDHNPPR
jgi:glycerol-3-phosphate acyltransferase PlsY